MKKRIVKILAVLTILILAGATASLAQVTVLPDPLTPLVDSEGNPYLNPITNEPLQIASRHDDFYSYSAGLLTALGYPGFDFSAGTGNLDLILHTGTGANNDPVAGGYVFPKPVKEPGKVPDGTVFSGTWGPAADGYNAATVDNLYGYLQTFGQNVSIPVFYFDMNQTGKDFESQSLLVTGQVTLWDPVLEAEVASWAFDDINNGAFDPLAWVLSPGTIEIGPYSINNNLGSAAIDFIVYAPTMDLSLYTKQTTGLTYSYEFVANFNFLGMNNGFEEIFLGGAHVPSNNNVVPEPATVMLLGSGLLGLLGFRKRIG